MSGVTVYYWKVYCTTDNRYEHVWAETEPTTCPVDPVGHSINSALTSWLVRHDPNVVQLQEELVATQGIYQFEGKKHVIPAGNPGDKTIIDLTWPYDITLLNGGFDGSVAQVGDEIRAVVAPDMVVGGIVAPAGPGSAVISVQSSVTDNVYRGYQIHLMDGVNKDDCGRCLNVDKVNGTITVEIEPVHSFSPASPTYVLICVEVIKSLFIGTARPYDFAEKKFGGKNIPAGMITRIEYTNTDGVQKDFIYYLEIMY